LGAGARIVEAAMGSGARGLLWSVGCVLWLSACRVEPEAEWLALRGVEPSLLEPGGTLRIGGAGFPAGRECEVRFDGRTARPGSGVAAVHARVRGRAVSDDQVEVPLDAALLEALGEHGTFRGQLAVAFAVNPVGVEAGGARAVSFTVNPVEVEAGAITGEVAVVLDVARPEGAGAGEDQRLGDRAQQWLEFAGIVAADAEPTFAGLVVAYARAGSAGAALGLRAGDVIAEVDGVRVHSLRDLAPAAHAQRVELRVQRPGQARPLSLSLSLRGLYSPDLSGALGRLSLLMAWLLTCVSLLSPLPSLSRWFARGLSRLRDAPPSELGLWGGQAARDAPRPRTRRQRVLRALYAASLPASLSVLGALLVWFEPAGFLAVRSISLYLGFLALSIALTLMSDGGTLRARLAASRTIAGRMLVMGVVIGCACALSGTRSFDGMVEWQGGWPFRWALFQKPALLVAFPLYIVYGSRLGASTLALEVEGRIARLLVAERVLTNIVLSALGAAIFAGGWQSPAELDVEGLDPRALGAALFVAKAWAFAWLLWITRRAGFGERLRTRTVALGCSAALAWTALWIWLEPSALFEIALGRAVGVTLLVLLGAAGLRALRGLLLARLGDAAQKAL
jgi:hypothetical protein